MTHFAGFEDCFILIGGTACDLWMGEKGIPFRATKDLDIVLVADALRPEFFKRFWEFIREGQYASHQQREAPPSFYRFAKPSKAEHPRMIELFTRNLLEIPSEVHLTPIPAGGAASSLSAILLEDDYYDTIVSLRVVIDGVPTIPAQCLIPLKATAYLDLTARKARGEPVDGDHIKKHRNDVFRLYLTLAPADRFKLPIRLQEDLRNLLDRLPPDAEDWSSIHAAVKNLPSALQVAEQLRDNFGLATGTRGGPGTD
jgi:hypothetical protein